MSADESHPSDAPIPTAMPTATPAPAPAPQVIVQRTNILAWIGMMLLSVALGICVLIIFGMAATYHSYFDSSSTVQEKYHSLSKSAKKRIAVIEVDGTILEGDGFVKKQIDRVRKDDNVVAIVLRINSPGGTVTGSDYIYHHLRKLVEERELPMVVSMGSICASGGYYIAMSVGDQPDVIYAEPTTWTGSIGVLIPHYDISGLLARYDIENDSLASGPLKQMGSMTRPMSDRERQVLQTLVDESFVGFKEIVKSGRQKFADDPEALDAVATGQVFTADQALANGLIDKIGFIEVAVERAAELAGYDTDDLRCVKYSRPQTFVEALMESRTPAMHGPDWDLQTILNLATPRAYYLYTWLPSIMSSSQP